METTQSTQFRACGDHTQLSACRIHITIPRWWTHYQAQFRAGGDGILRNSIYNVTIRTYNITKLTVAYIKFVAQYKAHAIPRLRKPHNSTLAEITHSSALAEFTLQFRAGGHITKHSSAQAEVEYYATIHTYNITKLTVAY